MFDSAAILHVKSENRQDKACFSRDNKSLYNICLATLPCVFGSLPVFQNPEANTNRNELRFYLPDYLNKLWHEAIKAAGAKPIRLYNGTRHSVGTQRSLEGWSREDISRLLGHASLAHTDKYIDCSRVETLRNKMSVSKPFLSVNHSTKVSGSQTDD